MTSLFQDPNYPRVFSKYKALFTDRTQPIILSANDDLWFVERTGVDTMSDVGIII